MLRDHLSSRLVKGSLAAAGVVLVAAPVPLVGSSAGLSGAARHAVVQHGPGSRNPLPVRLKVLVDYWHAARR